MRKKLMIGLFVVFFLFAASANSVFAWGNGNGGFGGGSGGPGGSNGGGGGKGKGRGGPAPVVPEPMSCLLFLASGATYAGIRYLRARRNSKQLNNHSHKTRAVNKFSKVEYISIVY